ncbi:MAG: succinate dehydrogenase assembly factor 2 [Rhodospirillales bacterium]|nr:succinate dehydrogenase assembly factor 2 [Alphaproteobacteria bacterium]MCB9986205.1 succinate dehydrogenase assembly factor 2 [Rhodospirillales bacterium]USO07238.1 MAG: succinate dehydrogenase assembly factor 2 [Rhodospirillales bacterium]
MDLADRRKKLIFRAWHRGTREMDLLLGAFADRYVPEFDEVALDEFERLMTCQDPDLYDWKCGRGKPSPADDSDVLRLFIAHTPNFT